MHRNRSVDVHQFAMIPKADIPRSTFDQQHSLKMAFDARFLTPIYCQEILPGDSFKLQMTAFVRLSTPLFPVMDNLYLETFFFYVPARILWTNFKKMMGEQDNPSDSISFTTPQIVSPAGGFAINTIYDYFGLPCVGQIGGGNTISINALPLRAYNRIYNDWFRDENIDTSLANNVGDGPDASTDYALVNRRKRKDYFTSCLPWPQKGATAVSLPLGTTAPIKTGAVTGAPTGAQSSMTVRNASDGSFPGSSNRLVAQITDGVVFRENAAPGASLGGIYPANLYADLSAATAATINQLRQSFQIQRVLEKDARGGTRYTEHVRQHFGVVSPDARLQRPEYLGGGSTPILFNPVPQTGQTGLTGGSTPLGTLGAVAAGVAKGHGFTQSFTEHGFIIGLCNVRADLSYQQGIRKMWSRATRYDYYLPSFAMLGEQAVLNKEIYADGSANDNNVFGYQSRWDEMRYMPSQINGLFRSTHASTIDPWHLAQKFTSLPTLSATFIRENPPLDRILAVGAAADGKQLLMDAFFQVRCARPLPMYSVPGMIDHF